MSRIYFHVWTPCYVIWCIFARAQGSALLLFTTPLPLSLCSISNPHFVYAAVYQHDKQPTPPPVGTAGGCLEKLADLQKICKKCLWIKWSKDMMKLGLYLFHSICTVWKFCAVLIVQTRIEFVFWVWGVFVCINMNLFVTADLHGSHPTQKQLKVMNISWKQT